jgi:hypothetical protein
MVIDDWTISEMHMIGLGYDGDDDWTISEMHMIGLGLRLRLSLTFDF